MSNSKSTAGAAVDHDPALVGRLEGLAYRMLGSVAEAEDVVQEARLRLHEVGTPPDNPAAFLHRIVSNLCVDRLRRLRVERRHYTGPWLPDPIAADSAATVELAEELSVAFMLMLENLAPAERIAFVLREGFDYSHAEIADVLDISEANARQRASRARRKIGDASQQTVDRNTQRKLLEALIERVARRDVAGVVDLLTPDAVAYTDGGGVVSAALIPVTDPQRIAQVTVHLANKAQTEGELSFHFVDFAGGLGLVVRHDGAIHSTIQLDVRDGKLARLYIVRNPAKLAHLG